MGIQQILSEDQETPSKQRHTASKLYRRLRDEWGYFGLICLLNYQMESHNRFYILLI